MDFLFSTTDDDKQSFSDQGGKRVNNKTRKQKYGSRRKVFNGGAEMTTGGLRKDDLIKNKAGRIVSAKRHKTMKQRFPSE